MFGMRLDERQLVDRLRVVGDRAVGVDGDRHRAHAEEAEGDQAEGEDRRARDHHASAEAPCALTRYAMPIRATITMPIQ